MENRKQDVAAPGALISLGIGALAGLSGGILLGFADSATVIFNYALSPLSLSQMLSFSLYPVGLYALIGCLGMAILALLTTVLIRAGGYSVSRMTFTGLCIGIFVLLTVSVVGSDILDEVGSNLLLVGQLSLVSILCGIAACGLTIYISNRTEKNRLIALCISLPTSLIAFLYSALWVRINLAPRFGESVKLLIIFGLLMLTGFLAAGLYFLLISVLRRNEFDVKKPKMIGFGLLAVVIFAFIAVSLIVNLGGERITVADQRGTQGNYENKELAELKNRPNILWIVMDTVRADHLSCYGYERKTTPNIDRIASEGVLFENAFSTGPWTPPSHASMFTGMFPSKHGMDAEHLYLADDFHTIAELLSSYGYKTFCVSNNDWIDSETNLDQGFDVSLTRYRRTSPRSRYLEKYLLISSAVKFISRYVNVVDAGARKTNKIIQKWVGDCQKSEEPFFIFANYMEVHDPYGSTPYAGKFLKGVSRARAERAKSSSFAQMSGAAQMSDEDSEILRGLYDGDILYLDHRIGQLIAHLRKQGILDDTVLIITSDHGQNIGDHGLLNHIFCVYDSLIHVPLIIRYPKLFPAGSRAKELVQLTDIFPTILDTLGVSDDGASEIQGSSLLPGSAEQRKTPFVVAEYAIHGSSLDWLRQANQPFDASVFARRLRTIRTDELKYIRASDGRDELYDMREDPKELSNILKARPEGAEELGALLDGWLNSFEHYGYR